MIYLYDHGRMFLNLNFYAQVMANKSSNVECHRFSIGHLNQMFDNVLGESSR